MIEDKREDIRTPVTPVRRNRNNLRNKVRTPFLSLVNFLCSQPFFSSILLTAPFSQHIWTQQKQQKPKQQKLQKGNS